MTPYQLLFFPFLDRAIGASTTVSSDYPSCLSLPDFAPLRLPFLKEFSPVLPPITSRRRYMFFSYPVLYGLPRFDLPTLSIPAVSARGLFHTLLARPFVYSKTFHGGLVSATLSSAAFWCVSPLLARIEGLLSSPR